MTTLPELLQQVGITKALIVDDAFDQTPLAIDLSGDIEEWTRFFEDANDDDKAVLADIFPKSATATSEDLRGDDYFVAALYARRADIRPALIEPLFERYDTSAAGDLEILEMLKAKFIALGMECSTCGRGFREPAASADLIAIDLFLGSAQNEDAVRVAIEGLAQVVDARPDKPPIVLLMSRRIGPLADRSHDFRDKARLLGSTFRIISKNELLSPKLDSLISRLAGHHADSQKVAQFLCAWLRGLDEAGKRAVAAMRMLDLSDYAQVQRLLLDAEDEPVGAYLVDVFDRVLQHELERDGPIIDAAVKLNALTSDTYPPPYVAGSPDLQSLVYRTLFQHRERLRLPPAHEGVLSFGDVLRRRPGVPQGGAAVADEQGAAAASPVAAPFNAIGPDDVLIVLTPACDLQRGATGQVLLLRGKLNALRPDNWIYGDKALRTAVIVLSDDRPHCIEWDEKHIEAISYPALKALCSAAEGFEIIARVRESHGLELQQRLLADLGRVGELARLPATFRKRVELYVPSTAGAYAKHDLPLLARDGGVCYVGRTEKPGEKRMRLLLPEAACDEVCAYISTINPDEVYPHARSSLAYLRTSGDLQLALDRGVELPTGAGTKTILSPTGAQENGVVRILGWISSQIPDAGTLKPGIMLVARDNA